MAVRKITRRRRDGFPTGAVLHLGCGRDFFGEGFGDDLELMREAWQDSEIRGAVFQRMKRFRDAQPWAYFAFGSDGEKPMIEADRPFVDREYRKHRDVVMRRKRPPIAG